MAARCDVMLISMPWADLTLGSIQLGILKPALEAAGLRVESRSLYLAFADHILSSTAHLPADARLGVDDYGAVAFQHYGIGMGDWIFAVAPYREASPQADEDYVAYLRSAGVADRSIRSAFHLRDQVPAFLDRCAAEILDSHPAVVGFTTTFSQTVPSLVLAKLLKQRAPSLHIVLGGANCEATMGAALHRAFPFIDVVVRGEGEQVLPALVRELLAGRPPPPLPGLCLRHEGRPVAIDGMPGPVAMDDVPTPDYEEYFERLRGSAALRDRLSTEVRVLIEGARGCWWGQRSHCTFCGLNGSSMTFRSKSPARVADEILTLAARHRVLGFDAVDNILDLGFFDTLLPRMKALREAGYDLTFFYEVKANLHKEQVRRLREAGVLRIQPGIESLSTQILRLMRKGTTALQNVRLLKWCAQFGVLPVWNILYGFPREPAAEYDRMASLVGSLTHLKPPSLVPLRVQRFSPYHQRPEAHGLRLVGPAPYYRFLYALPEPALMELAYDFAHVHEDGRDPERYIAPMRAAVAEWESAYRAGSSLRYERGPGFVRIFDRRQNLSQRIYCFEEAAALIYLACDRGATVAGIGRALDAHTQGATPSEDEIHGFLRDLVDRRLVYEEEGRYLSLALPMESMGDTAAHGGPIP